MTATELDPRVLAQINALEQEKESRTPAQQKIDSRLLYKMKMQRREAITEGVPVLESELVVDDYGFIAVDITANVSKEVTERLNNIGAHIIAAVPQFRSITARVPIGEIESIAAMSDVVFVQPQQEGMTNGSAAASFYSDYQPNALTYLNSEQLAFGTRASGSEIIF